MDPYILSPHAQPPIVPFDAVPAGDRHPAVRVHNSLWVSEGYG